MFEAYVVNKTENIHLIAVLIICDFTKITSRQKKNISRSVKKIQH